MAAYHESLDVAKLLVDENPDNTVWQDQLAGSYIRAGDIEARMDPGGALATFNAGIAVARRLSERDPTQSRWKRSWALTLLRAGQMLQRLGKIVDAETVLKEAIEVHAAALKLAPHLQKEHTEYWVKTYRIAALATGKQKPENAQDYWNLGYALKRQKKYATAVAHMAKALEDPGMRVMGTFYNAACAAALVTGDQAEHWRDQAMAWLTEDFRLTSAQLDRVVAELADKATTGERRAWLENERNRLRKHFKWARDGDPDLANLRGRPDFKALFPD